MFALDEKPLAVIGIPARDEADFIGQCLAALDAQIGARLDHIVLLVNNSSDATADLARSTDFNPATKLHVVERTLAPDEANAGTARRLAMELAAQLAGRQGVVLTTDADGLVDPDWLLANLECLRAGADAVAGSVELHPADWGKIPVRLHEADAKECAYDGLCDEIHARLDPDPGDPWPRHTHHSGASIAVRASAFSRCGGVPALACAEDRALIAALRRIDAQVRHAPEVHVMVSGRTQGRAAGGMADTIRRRLLEPDKLLDSRLEPAVACARRALARAEARRAFLDPRLDRRDLAARLRLPGATLDGFLCADYLGQAWDLIEAKSPALERKPVPVALLHRQMMAARTILKGLRENQEAQHVVTNV